jgi:hypothetical protein
VDTDETRDKRSAAMLGTLNESPRRLVSYGVWMGTGTVARRHNAVMRVERSRENVFTVTATGQELSALVAGARIALEAMRAAPEPPPAEALEVLERVLGDFDRARDRLTEGGAEGG